MVRATAPDAAARELRSDARRNEAQLIRAATAAVHRDGLQVPMGTIAAQAGVGVGTLYRRFRTRDDLLRTLTHRSFEQVLVNAQNAERDGATPTDCLRRFIEAAISQRNELVLPLHGGPAVTDPATVAVRAEVHRIIGRIIERGVTDQSLAAGTTPRDIVTFGALLAQPRADDPRWDATCHRLLTSYLRGLAPA